MESKLEKLMSAIRLIQTILPCCKNWTSPKNDYSKSRTKHLKGRASFEHQENSRVCQLENYKNLR